MILVIKEQTLSLVSLVSLVKLAGVGTLCPVFVSSVRRSVIVKCAMCWMCTCDGHCSEKKFRPNQKFLS